jgi:hypothetical protein
MPSPAPSTSLSKASPTYALAAVPLLQRAGDRVDTVNVDSGAMIRDGIRSVARLGFYSEDLWPYDIKNFRIKPD